MGVECFRVFSTCISPSSSYGSLQIRVLCAMSNSTVPPFLSLPFSPSRLRENSNYKKRCMEAQEVAAGDGGTVPTEEDTNREGPTGERRTADSAILEELVSQGRGERWHSRARTRKRLRRQPQVFKPWTIYGHTVATCQKILREVPAYCNYCGPSIASIGLYFTQHISCLLQLLTI